jgi:hypothetical protein
MKRTVCELDHGPLFDQHSIFLNLIRFYISSLPFKLPVASVGSTEYFNYRAWGIFCE